MIYDLLLEGSYLYVIVQRISNALQLSGWPWGINRHVAYFHCYAGSGQLRH
jgi:hypothetical protein